MKGVRRKKKKRNETKRKERVRGWKECIRCREEWNGRNKKRGRKRKKKRKECIRRKEGWNGRNKKRKRKDTVRAVNPSRHPRISRKYGSICQSDAYIFLSYGHDRDFKIVASKFRTLGQIILHSSKNTNLAIRIIYCH